MQVVKGCVNGYVVIFLGHYIFLVLTDQSRKGAVDMASDDLT